MSAMRIIFRLLIKKGLGFNVSQPPKKQTTYYYYLENNIPLTGYASTVNAQVAV